MHLKKRERPVARPIWGVEPDSAMSGLARRSLTRREFLRRAALISLGSIAGLGALYYYWVLPSESITTSRMSSSVPPSDDLYLGDESLPDLSSATFNHIDPNGNPVRFLWGVATSSYQNEGNITNNDWDYFTSSRIIRGRVEAISRLGNADIRLQGPGAALDHWNLDVFQRDLQRARDLGINAFRMSLEWSRIQPWMSAPSASAQSHAQSVNGEFSAEAVAHYQEMVAMIRDQGMEPILTLNHYTLPRWVLTPPNSTFDDGDFLASLRGWESERAVDAFRNFVEMIVPKLKKDVDYWVTLNEPTGLMGLGYLLGVYPPGFVLSGGRARKVMFNLIEAHVRAYDVIKRLGGDNARVGIAHAMVFPKAAGATKAAVDVQAAAQFDYTFNRLFLEAIVDGIENRQISMNSPQTRVREDWKGRLDFIGINYYGSSYIFKDELVSLAADWAGGRYYASLEGTDQPHNSLTEQGTEIYPGGLYRFLKYLDARFHLPVLITENGISASSDPPVGNQPRSGPVGLRGPYIIAHLQQVLHAIKEGVNVLGYTYWTLADNWEWTSNCRSKYGLYSVDRGLDAAASPSSSVEADSLSRTLTQGAIALQHVIALGKLGDAALKFGTISASGDRLVFG